MLAAEWATSAERGLDWVKVHKVEAKTVLQKSLADTKAVLQGSLEALELEQKPDRRSTRKCLRSGARCWGWRSRTLGYASR